MLIYLTKTAIVAGTEWPAGTKLECPERDARKALESGVASAEPPSEAPTQPVKAPETDAADEVEKPRRGRPPKSE